MSDTESRFFFPFPPFPISTSNGKVYVAQVKERAAARKMYDAAKKQGKTAGLVATKSVPYTFFVLLFNKNKIVKMQCLKRRLTSDSTE